jgi:hypothetical protein
MTILLVLLVISTKPGECSYVPTSPAVAVPVMQPPEVGKFDGKRNPTVCALPCVPVNPPQIGC